MSARISANRAVVLNGLTSAASGVGGGVMTFSFLLLVKVLTLNPSFPSLITFPQPKPVPGARPVGVAVLLLPSLVTRVSTDENGSFSWVPSGVPTIVVIDLEEECWVESVGRLEDLEALRLRLSLRTKEGRGRQIPSGGDIYAEEEERDGVVG